MIVVGNTTLDHDSRVLSTDTGRQVRLTRTETTVLGEILRLGGLTARGDALMNLIWAGRENGPADPILRVRVCNLRKCLRAIGSTVGVRSEYGRGYRAEVENV